jgi:hypothetical protein
VRVTFDTNALSDVIAPETSQRGALGTASGKKVRAAVEADLAQGFFSETLITLEGIKNADRSAVFGSTTVDSTYRHGIAPDGNGVTYIDMRVEQPARKPLDQRQADRFQAAFDLGMKLLLGAPIIGMKHVDDPEGKRYLAEPDEATLTRRLERHWDVATAIEARGLGCAQAKQLAREIQADIGGDNSFFVYLGKPRSPPEQKKIKRATAEWTDGESVAAHYAYGIDLFCSEDFGESASPASVLDNGSRAWLTDAFGIQFVTLAQLADMVTA